MDITYTLFSFFFLFVIYLKMCRVELQLFSKDYIENVYNKPEVANFVKFSFTFIVITDETIQYKVKVNENSIF